MFGRIGAPELILILVIALIIFGPRKLPEIGKAIGSAWRNFRRHSEKITDEFDLSDESAKKREEGSDGTRDGDDVR